jgi:hypothetical protein
MSRHTRPTPSVPNPSTSQRSLSLDATESTSSGFSTPSSPDDPHSSSTVNVKFAPLPETRPRDRNSPSYPLGIAARSRILQQRRDVVRIPGYREPGTWSDAERRSEGCMPIEVQEEDPLEVLGKLIADKSRSLWRRATSKASSKQSDKVKDGTRSVVSETTAQKDKHTAVHSQPPSREVVPPEPSSSGPLKQTSEISKKKKSGGTTMVSSQG